MPLPALPGGLLHAGCLTEFPRQCSQLPRAVVGVLAACCRSYTLARPGLCLSEYVV